MEVAWKGLAIGCRFFSLVGAMGIPCFILNPMIRTLAIERGHVSPLELLQDRYRSHTLNVLTAGVMVASLIISCGAQLLAVKTMLQALTNDATEAQNGTILVCAVITLCEFCGGFRGISRIDTAQMIISIGCAVVISILITSEFGGFQAVVPEQCRAGRPGLGADLDQYYPFQTRSLMCKLNASASGLPCMNGCAVGCMESEPIECDQVGNFSEPFPRLADAKGYTYPGTEYAERFFETTSADGVVNCSVCTKFEAPQCSGCYSNAWIFDAPIQIADDEARSRTVPNATVDFAALVRQPHAWQGDYGVWKVFGLAFMVAVGGHGGSIAPHVFQRVVSADSDKTLKNTLLPVFPAGWITLLAGLMCGVTWMGLHGPEFNFDDDGVILPGAAGLKQPLAGMYDDLIDLGGTNKFFGLVALSSAIASLLTAASMTSMGCGSIIAVGIFRNILWPIIQWGDARGDWPESETTKTKDNGKTKTLTLDSQTVYFSKVVTVICLFTALFQIALPEHADLSELFDWSVGLAAQGTPAFWFSGADILYLGRRVHSVALTLGMVFGLIGSAIIHFAILVPDENGKVPEVILPAAAWGVAINWAFTLWFIVSLPGSLADSRQNHPKPAWLEWDVPTTQFLRKFGKNYLTFNEAERICNKNSIPTHRTGGILGGLLAWCITVAALPWWDMGGETTPDGVYTPPVPDPDSYLLGLPQYALIQIAGAVAAMPIYMFLVSKYWDAPHHAVSGRLGAISTKRLNRMTAQDVSMWLFQFHQDDRPKRDEEKEGKPLLSLAWGIVLDHYITDFRRKGLDGETLSEIARTKNSAITALKNDYGVQDEEHAVCLANEIHTLKSDGWVTEDIVYSREWEEKLIAWSKKSIDEFGCGKDIDVKSLLPKTLSARQAKQQANSDVDSVSMENPVAEDPTEGPGALKNQKHYSIGRLEVADEASIELQVAEDRADPIRHGYSNMYLRWDPYATDRATMLGEAAWTNVMERLKIGNPKTPGNWLARTEFEGVEDTDYWDAGDGMARVKFIFELEKFTQPWEHASNHVVPWRPEDISRHNLTRMLHSKTTRNTSTAFDDAIPANWAVRGFQTGNRDLQGRLSRTCLIRPKYHDETGAVRPGPKALVAKFLPRQNEFLKSRCDYGAGSIDIFRTEVFIYDHELMTANGMPQPKCYFEAHDPERDCFCILMEDMHNEGFSSGETLSELSGRAHHNDVNMLPDMGLYSELVRILADSNSRRYNATNTNWVSPHGDEFDLGKELLGFDSPEYVTLMNRQLKDYFSVTEDSDDTIYQDVGFKELCAWLEFDQGVDKCYTESFENLIKWMMTDGGKEATELASRAREDGGWMDSAIVHGDCRIDNIWFPTPLKPEDIGYDEKKPNKLRPVDGDTVRFIDFQHVKRASTAYDITVFLAHSVSTEWRRENQWQILSLYFDALQEQEGYQKWVEANPGEELTWEVFLLNVQFCLFFYMHSIVVFGATMVSPFEEIDPKRFFRGGTYVRRFLEMWDDWSPKEKLHGEDAHTLAMQRVLEAAAKRSRQVETERVKAGWTKTKDQGRGNAEWQWKPPVGGDQKDPVDWKSMRTKWIADARGTDQDPGLLPAKFEAKYMPRGRRDKVARNVLRGNKTSEEGRDRQDRFAAPAPVAEVEQEEEEL